MADPASTPASPFRPSAVEVPRDGPGCSKPLLLGCGFLLLLVVIGFVILRIEAPAMLRWMFRAAETSLAPRLPADTTPAERARLHRAFEAAGRSIGGGDQADLANLQRVQRELMTLIGSEAPLTRQQVRELTESLEALAHRSPAPAGPPAPTGAPASPN